MPELLDRFDYTPWPSKTFRIDWDKKRLLSQRIDGKEAVAQAAKVALITEYKEFPIFSDRFGLEIKEYIGKERDYVRCNLERLIKECLSPDLRISKVKDFKMTDLDYSIACEFTIETDDGEILIEGVEIPIE